MKILCILFINNFCSSKFCYLAETIKELEQMGNTDAVWVDSSPSTSRTEFSSPRKRRGLFSSYDDHCIRETSFSKPTAAAVVLLYVDNLPSLTAQARRSKNPWEGFLSDSRLKTLHMLLEKIMCIPATSAPVERVFSHGGLFMRPHRARLGSKVLSKLVFLKCNKHLN